MIILNWNYNGWRNLFGLDVEMLQKDWNQTLTTKMNEAIALQSNEIKEITIPLKYKPIIDKLDYYNDNLKVLLLKTRDYNIRFSELDNMISVGEIKINVLKYESN